MREAVIVDAVRTALGRGKQNIQALDLNHAANPKKNARVRRNLETPPGQGPVAGLEQLGVDAAGDEVHLFGANAKLDKPGLQVLADGDDRIGVMKHIEDPAPPGRLLREQQDVGPADHDHAGHAQVAGRA